MLRNASSRRVAVTLLVAVAALLSFAPRSAWAESPAGFMQRVANEMIAASRNSPQALASVIRSHGDIPTIGLTALGPYATKLAKGDRPTYYNGMVSWMARYAWSQKGDYPVAKAVMVGQSETADGATVDSVVTLRTGQSYDIRFILKKRGSVYKVRDAEYIGFAMSPNLDRMFQKYIGEHGDNPKALVQELNR